ncbi:MAG: putative 4-amino-4-deoxy-L-arabinose-phosphoundecaprenol flippase subunit ArnF [Cyanobacteriota bacterium]
MIERISAEEKASPTEFGVQGRVIYPKVIQNPDEDSSVTPQEFGLLLISVISSSLGQFCLKLGALQLGQVTGDNALSHVLRIATTPALLAGLAAYGVGAISYILLLTRVKLSVAAPSASLIYLASVLMGHFVFGEALPPDRLLGLGLIVLGVVLVTTR